MNSMDVTIRFGLFIIITAFFVNCQSEITVNEVEFFLFTRKNPTTGRQLRINDTDRLEKSDFNRDWPVRFIIHGYESGKESNLNIVIRDAYLQKGNFNIIVVDWSAYSHTLYPVAMMQVEPVGRILGEFTKFLDRAGVPFDKIYLIGHSLGAQISGAAGHYIAPEKYNTIFALDPARPGFEFASPDKRIDPTDAKYVESIQTDTNLIGAGLIEPAGTASFYPNYLNNIQPGCDRITCSHTRSIDYFAESINSKIGFLGKICPICFGYVQMGGDPSEPKRGIYFFPTNSRPPFARGEW